jgi:hypothetical protein
MKISIFLLCILIILIILSLISIFILPNFFSKNESYKTQILETPEYITGRNIDDIGLIDIYSDKDSDILSNTYFNQNPSTKNIKYDYNRYIKYNRRRVPPSFSVIS